LRERTMTTTAMAMISPTKATAPAAIPTAAPALTPSGGGTAGEADRVTEMA
jgi:hypothetical protein